MTSRCWPTKSRSRVRGTARRSSGTSRPTCGPRPTGAGRPPGEGRCGCGGAGSGAAGSAERRLIGQVHGSLLGRGPATVDADVGGHRVRLLVAVRTLVGRHQAAGPRLGGAVVVARVVLVGPLVVGREVRLLLGQQLVEALAAALLVQRGPEPGGAAVALAGVDAGVQHVGREVVGLSESDGSSTPSSSAGSSSYDVPGSCSVTVLTS